MQYRNWRQQQDDDFVSILNLIAVNQDSLMNLKKFHEKDMQTALKKVRDELGDAAVIISTEESTYGVEVTAAADYEAVANSDCVVEADTVVEELSSTEESEQEISEPLNLNDTKITNAEFLQLHNELNQLRNVIESQTEIISWNKILNKNKNARKNLQKLSVAGFGFNLSKSLLDLANCIEDLNLAWEKIEHTLQEKILITKNNIIETGGIAALVGPTGVGKTTTIAKIAAQYALLHKSQDIVLISTDHYRIGAHDQISIYGNILNVPVIAAYDHSELNKALKIVKDKKLVLIDTAGFSQRDSRVNEIINTITQQPFDITKYLVVAANSQLCVQKEIINNYHPDFLDGAIISKTDEASQIGGVLTCLIDTKIPIAFETNGQRVPEDILRACKIKLQKKIFVWIFNSCLLKK